MKTLEQIINNSKSVTDIKNVPSIVKDDLCIIGQFCIYRTYDIAILQISSS